MKMTALIANATERKVMCPECNGTGVDDDRWNNLYDCHGSSPLETDCPECGGKGRLPVSVAVKLKMFGAD